MKNNNEFIPKTPEEFKKAFKKVRHKAEVPLYCLGVMVSILIILIFVIGGIGFKEMGSAELEARFLQEGVDASTASMLGIGLSFLGSGAIVAVIIAMLGIFLYGYYYQYAKVLAYAVKVTPQNFPEIYELVQEYAKVLGLKIVPDVYIDQNNGEINAFATWLIGRNIIKVNAEIVEVAYMENKDLEPVKFILGHEFGHIYLKHVNVIWRLAGWIWEKIPVLGSLLNRSREYSCDRVGQLLTGQKASEKGMALLTVGRHLYAHMNAEDYMQNIMRERNFVEKFSLFIYNMFGSHPIQPYRVEAILDSKKESGRLL